jgi:hypothetical protein
MTRIRLQKDTEQSLVPGSIITTDALNEARYVSPGTADQVLKIIAGFPTWSNNISGITEVATLAVGGTLAVPVVITAASMPLNILDGDYYVVATGGYYDLAAIGYPSSVLLAVGDKIMFNATQNKYLVFGSPPAGGSVADQVWADTAGVQVTNSTSVPHTAEAKRTGATLIGSVGAFATAQTKLQVDTGDVNINDTLTTTGTITKGGVRYDHNFGTNNTFHGKLAGNLTLTGTGNTGEGVNALIALTSGINNTAVGSNTLISNTTGSTNTAIGRSLILNTTGSGNVAIGDLALSSNLTSNNSVAVGANALRDSTVMGVAVGQAALRLNTTGTNNTAVGFNSLSTNTTGTNNTAIGINSLAASATGGSNTAIGSSSLVANTTGQNNTAVGAFSATTTTIGANNTAIGFGSQRLQTSPSNNTTVGSLSLENNVTGQQNTAVGASSLNLNTASDNSSFGYNSSIQNTTGTQNCSFGSFASSANTTGGQNNSFGYRSLFSNTSGIRNCSFGNFALSQNLIGNENATLGHEAGYRITSNSNVAVGALSMGNMSAVSAGTFVVGQSYKIFVLGTTDFTLIGASSNTTGIVFTATGLGSGTGNAFGIVSGAGNTAVGSGSLKILQSGANNSALGFNSGSTVVTLSNTTSVGANSQATQSNQVMLGDLLTTEVRSTGAFFGLSFTPSDERIKENVQDLTPEIVEALLSVKPKLYFNTLTGKQDIGVVAQELPEILKPLFITVSDQYDRAATEKRIAETNGENTEPVYIQNFMHVDYQRLALMIALVK